MTFLLLSWLVGCWGGADPVAEAPKPPGRVDRGDVMDPPTGPLEVRGSGPVRCQVYDDATLVIARSASDPARKAVAARERTGDLALDCALGGAPFKVLGDVVGMSRAYVIVRAPSPSGFELVAYQHTDGREVLRLPFEGQVTSDAPGRFRFQQVAVVGEQGSDDDTCGDAVQRVWLSLLDRLGDRAPPLLNRRAPACPVSVEADCAFALTLPHMARVGDGPAVVDNGEGTCRSVREGDAHLLDAAP